MEYKMRRRRYPRRISRVFRRRGPLRRARRIRRFLRFRRTRFIRRRAKRLLFGSLVILALRDSNRVYKVDRASLDAIENDTGKKAEDLSDDEFEESAEKLGIKGEAVAPDELEKVQYLDNKEDNLSESEFNFCPSCGKDLEPGAAYCSNCGTKIHE